MMYDPLNDFKPKPKKPSTARLTAAVDAVLALHEPEEIAVHEGYGAEVWCPDCKHHYPCPTVAAIQNALVQP